MDKLLSLKPIQPTLSSVRAHFARQTDHPPPPIANPDSLAFEAHHRQAQRFAAVLIPLVDTGGQLDVLLTRRAEHLRNHPGQISFPGGGIEASDETVIQAALRECEEEIGLTSDKIETLGQLGRYYTITGYSVVPVVGLVSNVFGLKPDPNEVDEVLRIPLNHFMNPKRFHLKHKYHEGVKRSYYATNYQNHYIWGVTAGIIMAFYQDLRRTH